MPSQKSIEEVLDRTIDELAEKLKKATEHLAEEAREARHQTISKLRAASAKLEQLARKLEESPRG